MMAVYMIKNLVDDKFYIGSAVDFARRKRNHVTRLNCKRSNCHILQNAWHKYGAKNFIFTVVEEVNDVEKLLEREQFYLDTLKPYYNICKVAGSTLGLKMSKETVEKLRIAVSKPVIQYDKEGNFIKEWSSIKEASDILNISKGSISGCCTGHLRTAGEFIFRHKDRPYKSLLNEELFKGSSREYIICDGDNQFTIKNLSKFCKENGLRAASIHHAFCETKQDTVFYKNYTIERVNKLRT